MNELFLIESSLLRVRPTIESDLDFVLEVEQAEDNRRFVGQWTREAHKAVLEDSDVSHLILESTGDNPKPVGYAIITGLLNNDQSLSLKRIAITDKGLGYGHSALKLLKELAFERWKAHRFWLDVKDYNERAAHLYASEGFSVEGVLRECIKVQDSFEALVVMSILSQEYYRRTT